MANNIKGITIELGGNTGPLADAMKDLNAPVNKIQNELKEVNRQLKFDPSNTTLLKQKQDLLSQSSEALKAKQAVLKEAVSQAQAQFEKGDLGADKMRAVQREYEKVTSQLKDVQKQETEVQKTSGTLGEKIKATFSGMGSSIQQAFKWENIKTAIGGIGVAVGAFLKSSIGEAKDAESANADLAQTLKSTAGASGMTMESLEGLSEALSKNTTFSDDQVKSGEGMMLTFTNIGKSVFPQATAALLDMSQKMGTDTKTQAMQLGKALNDPVNGISALTRVGVTFTQQQKDQIAAMVKTGDTAGAQKVILAELNKEFGGQAAAAADTYEGKQKQLQNTLKEVQETVGTSLIPVITEALKAITPVIQTVAKFVTDHPKLTAAILAIIAVVGTLIGGLSLLTTVTSAFTIVETASLGPIALVMAAIVGLVAVVAVVVAHWQPISAFFINLWNTVTGAFVSAWNGIKTFFASLFTWIGAFFMKWGPLILTVIAPFIGIPLLIIQHWGQISTFFSKLWTNIITFFTTLPAKFTALMATLGNAICAGLQAISTFFLKLPGMIGYALGFALGTIVKWGVNLGVWIVTEIPKLINSIGTFFAQLPGKIWSAAVAGLQKLGDFEISIINWAARAIPQFIANVGNFFAQLPGRIWNAAASGIQKLHDFEWSIINWAAQAIPQFVGNVGNFFAQLPGRIWNAISGAISRLGSWGGEMLNTGRNAASSVVSGIVSFFSGLPGDILNIGKNVVQGLWDGITGAWHTITNGVKNLTSGFVSGFKNALGIHSPSTIFAGIGGFVSQGLANGISDTAGTVTSALQSLAANSAASMKDSLMGSDGLQAAFNTAAASLNTAIPSLSSAQQVSKAMSAASGTTGAQTGGTASGNTPAAAQNGTQAVFQQTVNNYSPKALTPAETARQTRNATRQLVLALQKG